MGSVNLDNTGSGADVTLSSDGTSLLLDGTAIGGGGDPDLYRDNAVNATTPTASGDNAFAIGSGAISAGNNSAALGNSRAGAASSIAGAINNNSSSYGTTGVNTVSFGTQSRATNNSAVSIGQSSIGSGYQSAAYGYNAVASGQDSFAGGPTTDATATNSTALGKNAQATHANATAVGYNAATSATNQVSLGALGYAVRISSAYTLPTSDGTNGQVLTTNGAGAVTFADAAGGADLYAANESSPTAQPSATGSNAIAIGDSAVASGTNSISLPQSNSSGTNSIAGAIANNTTSYGAQGTNSISIGALSKATALAGTAVGYAAVSTHAASSAFGTLATTTATNQIALGGSGITARISGAYNLPTSDGTNGQVLTTDGSGNVNFAAAGGGSLDLYAENPSTPTSPTVTGTNAVGIGHASSSTSSYSIAVGPFSESSALYSGAFGTEAISSSNYAISLGKGRAHNLHSFAAQITNNTSSYGASGSNSVAMGYLAKATNTYGVALGKGAQATGNRGYAIGNDSTASATKSGVFGGDGNTASGGRSVAIGGYYANARENNKVVFGGGYLGVGAGTNLNQSGILPLGAITTDATATVMRSDNLTAGTANQLILPNNSAFAFHGTIVARQQAANGTACAAWKVEGLIRREANAGTTVLVNSATTVLDNTPSWGLALSADTTNGALKVTATGAAATNIRWVATIHTSEVTYA